MSDSSERLNDAITEAVMDWCSNNGGGFPVAFIAGVSYVNAEGESMLSVVRMDSQPITASMGLATYLDTYFRDDARMIWRDLELAAAQEDEDDDE